MNGMVAMSAFNDGFFGSGCYSTLNIEYALLYASGQLDDLARQRVAPADGRYPVTMFCALANKVYPIAHAEDYTGSTQYSDYLGRPLKSTFDCHVVCVSKASDWQAVIPTVGEYVEVVVGQEVQYIPVAVLWFRAD
jgi:hypothetical protein